MGQVAGQQAELSAEQIASLEKSVGDAMAFLTENRAVYCLACVQELADLVGAKGSIEDNQYARASCVECCVIPGRVFTTQTNKFTTLAMQQEVVVKGRYVC